MRVVSLLAATLFSSCLLVAAEGPRVFITDSKSREIRGNTGGTGGAFGGHSSGGARPQTAEIIKTFGERCPSAIVTMKQEKADYVVVLEHEGGKSLLRRDNKVAVFTPSAIKLPSGEHVLGVKKSGYKAWQRKIKVTGGDISLVAELEKTDSKGGQ